MAERTAINWQAHTVSGYDAVVSARCDAIESRLSNPMQRQNLLLDPRPFHKELFDGLTPTDYPECAGTYRGTEGTELVGREASAESQLAPGHNYSFVHSTEVATRMAAWSDKLREFISTATDADQRATTLAWAFAWFGYIHPFLDGNGHTQRLIAIAVSKELGMTQIKRWPVHPRPYDTLLAVPLERFTIARGDASHLGAVSEYLGFYFEASAT